MPRIAEKIVLYEKDELFKFAIEGALDVIDNDGFIIPSVVELSTAQWFDDSDSILFWFNENYLHDLLGARKNKKVGITDVYSKFRDTHGRYR